MNKKRLSRFYIIISALFLATYIYGEYSSYESYNKIKLDSLFNLNEQTTFCTVIKNRPAIYFSSTFLTVELPFNQVESSFHDFKFITNSIGIISRFNKISENEKLLQKGLYDFEAKISFCKGWAILGFDSFLVPNEGRMHLVLRGNDNPILINGIKQKHNDMLTTKLDSFYLKFIIEKRTAKSTRIAFISWMAPHAYVPHWLYVLAADFAVPSILNDIKKALLIKYSKEKHQK